MYIRVGDQVDLYIARLHYVRKKERKGRGRGTQSLIGEYNLLNARLFFSLERKKFRHHYIEVYVVYVCVCVCVCVWMRDETHRVGWRKRKERRKNKKRIVIPSGQGQGQQDQIITVIRSRPIALSFIHVGIPLLPPPLSPIHPP